ncbi:MAG: C45 family autoproteolytic acyltransferase/hydrolase [Gemmataceae bacterium]
MTTAIEAPRLIDIRRPAQSQVQASRALLEATVSGLRSNSDKLRLARDVLARYPEHRNMTEQAAALIHADPVDIMLATLSYDLCVEGHGCSTVALAASEGPILARNLDWSPADLLAQAGCVLPTACGLEAGFVGCVGVVTGLSNRGFALALNAIWCGHTEPGGYPVLLFLRHLLDHASGFAEALNLAATTPLMSGCLISLTGTRNDERAVVERTPSSSTLRTPYGDEPLVVTNHYRPRNSVVCCNRYDQLMADSLALPARPTDERILACLTREPVFNGGTTHHVLMRPSGGSLRLFVPGDLLAR